MMKRIVLSVCAAVAAAVSAWAENAHPLDGYVKDGLIGWWDGEYNSVDENGTPVHKDNATTWASLVEGKNGEGFTGNGLRFGSKSVTVTARTQSNTLTDFPTSYQPLTLQIVARCTRFKLNTGYTDYLFSAWYGNFGLNGGSNTYWGTYHDDLVGKRQRYGLRDPVDLMQIQSFTHIFATNGLVVCVNSMPNPPVLEHKTNDKSTPAQNLAIGSSQAAPCHFEFFSVRLYNRVLTDDEIAQNAAADEKRMFGHDEAVPVPIVPFTKDSYVQDGLYAQWDGYYNTLEDGVPKHVDVPTQWDDLKGHAGPFLPTDTCILHSDHVTVKKNTTAKTSIPWMKGVYEPCSIEAVAYCSTEKVNPSPDAIVSCPYGYLAWGNGRITTASVSDVKTASRVMMVGSSSVEYPLATLHTYVYTATTNAASAAPKLEVSIDGKLESLASSGGTSSPWDKEKNELTLGSARDNPCVFEYYSIRLYNRPLTEEEQRWNHYVDEARFVKVSMVTNLVVTGTPRLVGEVSPNYGVYGGIKETDVVRCSAPTNARNYRLLGYEVQTNGVDGTWLPWLSGTEPEFHYFQPKAQTKVVWKWRSPGFMLMVF